MNFLSIISLELDNLLMRLYKVSFFIVDSLYSALSVCSNHMLHFHGFHCKYCIPFLKFCSFLYENFRYCPWHWCYCLQRPTLFRFSFFSKVWLEFKTSWITSAIKQIDSVIIIVNKVLHFSDLPIYNNV